jgi:hypothetical protein
MVTRRSGRVPPEARRGGELTEATGEDNHEAVVGLWLLDNDGEPGGFEVLGDSAYGTGQARAALADAGHIAVIKPVPVRPAVAGGFTLDDFIVDEVAGTVVCPNGITRRLSTGRSATFGVACGSCPLRARCATSKAGRIVRLHEHDALLRQARRDWANNPHL